MIVKDDEYYKKELSEDIMKIMLADRNKESYARFKKTLKGLKAQKCIVRNGWTSGKSIGFTLAFEKYGEGEPFNEFIDGIEDKSNVHYFITGLQPEIFHYNPRYSVNNETHSMLMFKLKRNE